MVQDGYSFHWDACNPSPTLTCPDGRRLVLPTDHFVPYVEESSPVGYACPTSTWFTAKQGITHPQAEPADHNPEKDVGSGQVGEQDGLVALRLDKEKDKECRSLLAPVPLRSSSSSLAQGIREQGTSTHSQSTAKGFSLQRPPAGTAGDGDASGSLPTLGQPLSAVSAVAPCTVGQATLEYPALSPGRRPLKEDPTDPTEDGEVVRVVRPSGALSRILFWTTLSRRTLQSERERDRKKEREPQRRFWKQL